MRRLYTEDRMKYLFSLLSGPLRLVSAWPFWQIIARRRLGKLKAVPLPVSEATARFRKVLEREKEKIGLSQNAFGVFWIPTNWCVGGQEFSGDSAENW